VIMKEAKTILDYLQFDTPTKEQKVSLEALSEFVDKSNKDTFFILSGAAGTGKTSITAALVGYLNANEVPFKIAAPTGRAARILGKKTKSLSNTIHAMIYTPESNKETGSVYWKLRPNKSKDYTVYIIDEASMIGGMNSGNTNEMFQTDDSLLNHLVKYVRNGNTKNKIVLLGDRNQLPPFDEDISLALDPNYLKKTYKLKGVFHYLTEVKRVEDGSYILQNAVEIRKSIDDLKLPMPEINAMRHRNVWAAAEVFASEFSPDNLDHSITIGRSHKANRMFNDIVRKNIFGPDLKIIENNDLLIVLQNWKRDDNVLYNGDHVLVEEINLTRAELVGGLHFVPIKIRAPKLDGTMQIIDDYLLVDALLAPDGKVPFAKENVFRAERFKKNKGYVKSGKPEDDMYVGALRLGYGYAITCQKAQGGEWEKVYVNTFGINDKKWFYTAVTRAKTELNVY
jgi:exodeoxyribonuclease-5